MLSDQKMKRIVTVYQIGLNLTIALFVVRGVLQVLETPLSYGMNAAISGIAGIDHMILGVSLVWLLVRIKKNMVVEA